MKMKSSSITSIITTSWLILAFVGLSASSLWADTVYVGIGSAFGTTGTGCSVSTGTSTTGGYSGVGGYGSTAAGNLAICVAGGKYNQGGSAADSLPTVQLTPTLISGGTYILYGTRGGAASSDNADAVFKIDPSGCTASAATTGFFSKTLADHFINNDWKAICSITLDAAVTSPTFTFTFHSGTLTGTSARVVANGFKFDQVVDGTGTADCGGITGPVANTDTAVTVTGASSSADTIKIVDTSNGNTVLGTLSETPVWGGGTVSVPVTGLIPTHVIKAIQTIAVVDSRLSTAPSATVQGTVTSQTWTGGSGAGGNDLWSNGANWQSGTAPVTGDFVIFAGSTRPTPDMDIDSMSVGQITFNTGAGSFNLGSTGGKTLSLAGNIIQNSANSQTLSLPLSLGISPTITNAGPLVISGEVSGINGYTKTGAGTLTISGGSANLYSGATTVSVGTLDVQKDGGLGSGNVTVASGATLKLGSGTLQTYIAPSANLLLQTGTPTVNLAFTGTDVINKLSFDGGTTFAAPGIWGAVGSGAANTSSRFTGTGLLQVQTSIWTGLGSDDNWSTAHNWTGDIAPNTSGDSVRFGGSTRPTPNMDNTYSVNSLVLDSTIGASFSITANLGTTLQIATAAGITNGSTFDHAIGADVVQGTAALIVNTGTGGKQITLSGDTEGTAGFTVSGSGTLYLSLPGGGNITGPALVNSGATLRLVDFSDLGANDGVQTLTLNGGTLQNDDTIAGHSILYWATAASLGALGGTFNVTASAATDLLYGDGFSFGAFHPGRALSGVGKLTKTGPGTLVMTNSIANTYQGGTLVQQGKLVVKMPSNLGSGAVTVASGATFELTAPGLFPSATNLLLQTGSPVVALSYTDANTVNKLSFDGGTTFALPGVWGAPGSGAANTDSRFTGTGLLNVTTGLVQPVSTTISNFVGTTLSYGGGAGSRFVLLGTNNIAAPLANWTRLATNSSSPGTFTIPAPGTASPRFYRVSSE